MNILGIDYGSKYVGIAIANIKLKIATPYKILKNNNVFFKELENIILQNNINKLVVGYPIGLSGKKTQQTRIIDKFIQELKQQVHIPVISFDERFTSKIADNLLSNKKPNHAVAANIILQDYLDKGV